MVEQQDSDEARGASTPPGFDPTRDIALDATTLRGIAHPLRLRILGSLRVEGPQTATQLAERMGESSASTSYHLRMLAAYGFVADAPELGKGRERWWRAAHRSTWFQTPGPDSPEAELGAVYLEQVGQIYADQILAAIRQSPELPDEWRRASDMSDYGFKLTVEETTRLRRELHDVLIRWRDELEGREAPDGARHVRVQTQVFPRIERKP